MVEETTKGGGDFMNNYEVMHHTEKTLSNAVTKKFDDLLVANGATIEKHISGAKTPGIHSGLQ